MLRLVDEVEGQAPRVGGRVGQEEALGRAAEHVRRGAEALRQHLGGGHGRAAGPHDLADAGERGRAERECRDPGRAVGPVDGGQPQLVGHRERRRVDRAGARHRRDQDGDLRHAGDDGRHADLDQHGREAPLAGGHVEAGRRDRGDLLPDLEAGPGLDEPPEGGGPDLGLVEEAAVADRLADPGQEGRCRRPRARRPARRAGRGGRRDRSGRRRSARWRRGRPRRRGRGRPRRALRSRPSRPGSKIAAVERARRRACSAASRSAQRRTARIGMVPRA